MSCIKIVVTDKKADLRDVCKIRCVTEAHLLEHARGLKNLLEGMVITGHMDDSEPAPDPLKSASTVGVLAGKLIAHLCSQPAVYGEVEVNPVELKHEKPDYIYEIKVPATTIDAKTKAKGLTLALKKTGGTSLHRESLIPDFNPESLIATAI